MAHRCLIAVVVGHNAVSFTPDDDGFITGYDGFQNAFSVSSDPSFTPVDWNSSTAANSKSTVVDGFLGFTFLEGLKIPILKGKTYFVQSLSDTSVAIFFSYVSDLS